MYQRRLIVTIEIRTTFMPELIHFTRSQLARAMTRQGFFPSKKIADHFVEAALTHITQALHNGKIVQLKGFGTFQFVPTRARQISRHVKTGQPFTIPASRRVRFTPSRRLLNGAT